MKNRFSQRVEKIQVSAIKQMPLLARKFSNTISLGQGLPSLATPKYIRDEVIKFLENDNNIGKYSLQPGMPKLKKAVADNLSKIAGRGINFDKEIFISVGAMEALATAISSVVERGDEVILFDPGYSSHIEQVLFAEGKPIFVGLDEEKNWQIDFDELEKSINEKTKAIIICNPSNPTGKVFSYDELKTIVRLATENDLFVIADETYNFLVYDDFKFFSLASFSELKDNLILCGSFSKEFAMTGWRVGYMFAPAEVISQALKVHDAFVICAPTISQYAALVALTKQPASDEVDIKEILRKRRDLICERLDKLTDLFSYQKPRGAYYVLAKYEKTSLNSWNFAVKLLEETGVITVPGCAFGPLGENHIRMSFGGTEEEIDEAFNRIAKWNKNLNN